MSALEKCRLFHGELLDPGESSELVDFRYFTVESITFEEPDGGLPRADKARRCAVIALFPALLVLGDRGRFARKVVYAYLHA